jgi:hypothetical protein
MAQTTTEFSAPRAATESHDRDRRSMRGVVASYLRELATSERPTPKLKASALAPDPCEA